MPPLDRRRDRLSSKPSVSPFAHALAVGLVVAAIAVGVGLTHGDATTSRGVDLGSTNELSFAPGPRLRIESEYDWGTIYEGESVSHAFRVKNVGDETLRFGRWDSCRRAIRSPCELLPGEMGSITFHARPDVECGAARATVRFSVASNDPTQPHTPVTLHGRIEPVLLSSRLLRVEGRVGSPRTGELEVILNPAVGATAIELSGVADETTRAITPLTSNRWRIRLSLGARREAERILRVAELHVSRRSGPSLAVPIEIEELSLEPVERSPCRRIVFGPRLERDASGRKIARERVVRLRAALESVRFRVDVVELYDLPEESFRVSAREVVPGRHHEFVVRQIDDLTESAFGGLLRVETDIRPTPFDWIVTWELP